MKPRYLIAQFVILSWWALDWAIFGIPHNGSTLQVNGAVVLGSFVILYAPFTLFVAVLVGILDGLGGRDEEILSAVLVAGLAALVSFLGLGLPELLNPSDARAMPVELRVALLIAMEAFMLLELGMAALVRLGRRRRREADA